MSASPMNGGTSQMLEAERAKCSFDVGKLQDMMGIAKRSEQRDNARKLFAADPAFAKVTHSSTARQPYSVALTAHSVYLVCMRV